MRFVFALIFALWDAAAFAATPTPIQIKDLPVTTTFGASDIVGVQVEVNGVKKDRQISGTNIAGALRKLGRVPFWQYSVTYANSSFNPGANPINSTGSGVTYWPNQNTFLLVDNTIVSSNPTLFEYSRSGTFIRKIVLTGFADPEEIHWLVGNSFAIAQERNTGTSPVSVDEIVVITLPTGGTDTTVDIATADRRLQMNTGNLTTTTNQGIEAFCAIGGEFFFTTEKVATTPAEWNLWKVSNSGSGTQSIVPTKVLRLTDIVTNRATDISGMAKGPDGNLWLVSDEGVTTSSAHGRLLVITPDGRLVEETFFPPLSNSDQFGQAEGIEFFTDVDGVVKIAISGENSGGTAGVDFMVLSPP